MPPKKMMRAVGRDLNNSRGESVIGHASAMPPRSDAPGMPVMVRSSSLAAPAWLALSPLVLLPLAAMGPNSLLAVYSIAILIVGILLLWRPGEPPILLFMFFYQWAQAATGALYGNAIGADIDYLVVWRGEHTQASALMLTGTLVLAITLRLAAGRTSRDIRQRIQKAIKVRPWSFWLRLYIAAWFFSAICSKAADFSGGLRIPLLTFADLKWAAYVLLTIAAFSGSKSSRTTWVFIFGFEFMLSIGGYFASFKDVFIYTMFGIVVSKPRFSSREIFWALTFGIAVVYLAILWNAIKSDYRAFVNEGTGQQVVTVDVDARLNELQRLIADIDTKQFQVGVDNLFKRLMYHHFFGAVIRTVPSVYPFTGGEIWGEAISRPFMPRLLFPNKRDINDSELTNTYTDLGVVDAANGGSISLGYMTEAYIDFGPYFMFMALGVYGLLIGTFYRWLIRKPDSFALAGASLACFAIYPAHAAESSMLKIFPTLVMSFLACWLVLRFVWPMVIGQGQQRGMRSARPRYGNGGQQ